MLPFLKQLRYSISILSTRDPLKNNLDTSV